MYEHLSLVIQLSGRFIYPDDFPGNQSVRINEAPQFIDGTTAEYVVFPVFCRLVSLKTSERSRAG
jgi:hypothetical protein